MKRLLLKCAACFCMSLMIFINLGALNVQYFERMFCAPHLFRSYDSGFVVYAATNPVSLFVTENEQGITAEIVFEEETLAKAFQLRLCYDGRKLNAQERDNYYASAFINDYNANQAALLNGNCLNQGKKSSVILLGLQTDKACATVKKGTTLAVVSFQYALADLDVAERAEALQTVYLQAEVIEGEEGNIVQGQEALHIAPKLKNQQSSANETTQESAQGNSHEAKQNQMQEDVQNSVQAQEDSSKNNLLNNEQNSAQNQENNTQENLSDSEQNSVQNQEENRQENLLNNEQNSMQDQAVDDKQNDAQNIIQNQTLEDAKENVPQSIGGKSEDSIGQKNQSKAGGIWLFAILALAFCALGGFFALWRHKKIS